MNDPVNILWVGGLFLAVGVLSLVLLVVLLRVIARDERKTGCGALLLYLFVSATATNMISGALNVWVSRLGESGQVLVGMGLGLAVNMIALNLMLDVPLWKAAIVEVASRAILWVLVAAWLLVGPIQTLWGFQQLDGMIQAEAAAQHVALPKNTTLLSLLHMEWIARWRLAGP